MRWLGPDAMAVDSPTWNYLLDVFYFRIQLYVLLSPYLCFISFFILIYTFEDKLAYFMQTKHLCVLIHISTKSEVSGVKLV